MRGAKSRARPRSPIGRFLAGNRLCWEGVHNYMDLLRPYVWCSVSNWGEVAVSTPQTFY